jgi:hypothetical protein
MWRQLHDGKRLPVFAIMLGVFFEFLPAVMYLFRSPLTPLLPYPCRLPEQVKIGRTNRLKLQQKAEQRLKGRSTSDLNETEYIRYSAEFHGIKAPLVPLAITPLFYLLRGVRKYYDYLRWDDLLIHRDGGVRSLIDEEVVIAALDRGLWDPESSVKDLRKRLEKNVEDTFKQELQYQKRMEQEEQADRIREMQRGQHADRVKQIQEQERK